MTERAEGFWWVRLRDFGGGMGDEAARKLVHAWQVVQVEGHVFVFPGVPMEFSADNPLAEWGPYLGKEPETIESLERKISEAFAAAVPRFVVPPQRD